jgi:hypothetical protein
MNSNNHLKHKAMPNFKVVIEIELDAETPLEAAKLAKEYMDGYDFQSYIQNDETKEVFSVDLEEEDENAVLPVHVYHPMIETVKV